MMERTRERVKERQVELAAAFKGKDTAQAQVALLCRVVALLEELLAIEDGREA